MPFSFGLLAGLLAIIVGAVFYAVTRKKNLALVLLGVGATITLIVLAVIVLAVNSNM